MVVIRRNKFTFADFIRLSVCTRRYFELEEKIKITLDRKLTIHTANWVKEADIDIESETGRDDIENMLFMLMRREEKKFTTVAL